MIHILITTLILCVTLFIIYTKDNLKLSENNLSELTINLDNKTICQEMLRILNNKHTKVEYNKDINSKLSYYNHKKDVIILKVDNKMSSRIVQIAHECIHTTQKRKYLEANKVFSNLQIMYFLISLLYIINNEMYETLLITIQLIVLLGTIFAKVVIEGDASYRSINLAKEYLKNKIDEKEVEIFINQTSKLIYELVPVYYFNFFSQGIIMIIINIVVALIT